LEQGPVQAHGGEAEGRQSGDCPALFFFWLPGKHHPRMAWLYCPGCPGAPNNKRPRTAGPFVFKGADIRQGRNRGDPDVPVGYRRRAVWDAPL